MGKNIRKLLSFVLVLIMLFNMLPLNTFAAETDKQPSADTTGQEIAANDVYIVEEIIEERSEYTKQFRMSNGLQMAAVYNSPVHYKADGQWKEIDNTLQLAATRSGNVYVNTAGSWQASFPESMTDNAGISITKDGSTINFHMAGELLDPKCVDDIDKLSFVEITLPAEELSAQDEGHIPTNEQAVLSVSESNAVAEIESVGKEEIKLHTAYPETIVEKVNSRLRYNDIYENTDVIFDLTANQVKESIVMEAYRDNLRGYAYRLEVGDLVPVLAESGKIELWDADKNQIVMCMPSPFLVDNDGEVSYDVGVSLEGENGSYLLIYSLPIDWLASDDRMWPVILDPVVEFVASNSNAEDQNVYQNTSIQTEHTASTITCGYDENCQAMRFFMKYRSLPALTSADVIVNATITLYMTGSIGPSVPVEIHRVTENWNASTLTWDTQPDFAEKIQDYEMCGNAQAFHTWDITELVRLWYVSENYGMVFKLSNAVENGGTSTWKRFYSADFITAEQPTLLITFQNNNGLESYWEYTATSAGRAGTGYVNQYSGNLVWIREDIGFGGSRMPVVISHIYTANDSTENRFGLGYGWRTNFNQVLYVWENNNAYGNYYVWEDSDGTDHYFSQVSANTYKDEDGLELTLTIDSTNTEAKYCITDKYGNASYFDSEGRLTKQSNNQQTKSNITITYTTPSSKLISSITDGSGRVYSFTYNSNNLLSDISYKSKGTKGISHVNFGYTNSKLTSVTDRDGKTSSYTYTANNLLTTAQDIDGYKISYTYTTTTVGQPNRIKTIEEYSGTTAGSVLNIEYAHNQTKFTDYNGNVQIVQFNNMGNTISIQDDQGRAQYAQYAINDPQDTAPASVARSTSTAKGNQLLLASKLQNTVGNILKDSSFENSIAWTSTNSAHASCAVASDTSYLGGKSLKITHADSTVEAGVHSSSFTIQPGETYTLSGYVKTGAAKVYLAIGSNSAGYHRGEKIPANQDWTRVEYSYTNNTTAVQSVYAFFLVTGASTTYVDCVQVEKAPTASRYNLVDNGDFAYSGHAWNTSTGRTTVTAANKAPAPQLDVNVYKMTGNPIGQNRLSQTVKVSGTSGDTFVLAGWAKADSVPIQGDREFAMIATFKKGSTTVNTAIVRFNYCADSTIEWQYAASPIVANGAYDSIVIELAYDYNANTVYFDGVQLYKERFGNSYTYDEDGNIVSVKDVQSQTTTYEYTNNDLTKQILPTGAVLTYTYDSYHNIKTATTDTGVVYQFGYDTYGNNTSVSIVSGAVKLTSSAEYTADGNRIAKTTDAAGNVTTYGYNEDTNVLEWVQYPEDTAATRTEYTYDDMYRLAKAEVNVSTGNSLKAEYGYTDDLLTTLTTGSTTYTFTYGAFSQIASITAGINPLASYTYTSRNNYLASLDYGNGDSVDYTYDKQGRVTKQTFEDGDTVTYKYDNNGTLASVTDSATGITSTYYYDYTDRLLRYADKGSSYSHIVGYEYDEINNLTALVETINGTEHKTTYAYDDDNRVTSVTNGSASEAYTYDAYSRVNKKVTKNGSTTVLTDTFTYRAPTSTTTSGQIATLKSAASGYNVTYTYTYDDNGNILSVSNGSTTTSYVYDSANQLTRENNQAAGKTWVWTYDDAGNILSKKEYAYTTGTLGSVQSTVNYTYDSTWGDLLTGYNGKTITSDTIGNMLSDGLRTYTWQHGREMVTVTQDGVTWTNTYNADGLRTKRTNGSTTYNYIYNGSSLSQMTVGGNTLYFAYDASGTPMSVTYNGTNYYYATNLQGDVTAILNTSGTAVVQYTYDAWGKILTTTGSMASTLGAHNPLRYRGYVYDQETTLYYLQSRYYDPEIGRFINADALVSTGQGILGNNMFAYCNNNPVIHFDISGTASRICISEDTRLTEQPWRDFSPGGGGSRATGSGIYAPDYGSVADKFYTVRILKFVMEQSDRTRHWVQNTWNIYVYTVERKAELEYQQVVTVMAFCEDVVRSPARTGDFVTMTFSNVSTFASYVYFCAAPTLGAGFWLFGNACVCIWTTLRYFDVISE